MSLKGILIAFEGIDGSGKSTQAKRLYQYLQGKGIPAVLTKEPSEGKWGKKIREIGSTKRSTLTPEEELDLFIQDRKKHVANLIQPSLDQKKIVITDRYYFSTIAYQGALGIDQQKIREANNGVPIPDIVFYLRIEPKNSIQRIMENRDGGCTQFEKKDYLEKVKEIFDTFNESYIYTIDASMSVEDVTKEVLQKTNQVGFTSTYR